MTTKSFIKAIKDFALEPGEDIVSFDVINLYPSIDTNEISEFINHRIKQTYGENKTLICASNLLFKEAFFQFNGKVYKQLKGVPVGSSILGYAAEMKLRNIENKLKEDIKEYIKI